MNKEVLLIKLRDDVKKKIRFLTDKPEENVDSSLKALWNKASGIRISSEKAALLPLPELTDDQIKTLYQLIELRSTGVPIAHITGRQNFMGIELISDKRALIPRKETEIIGKKAVEKSLEMTKSKNNLTVIDTCCGSGNLGLSVAYYNPLCTVFVTDISQEAIELARENIVLLGLQDRVFANQGDLLAAYDTDRFHRQVDLLICNPPYISSAKVVKMDVEISAHEPSLAFDGGMLGTGVIQRLIREAPKFMTDNGYLMFEVGLGQGPLITQLCSRTQLYSHLEQFLDDSGNIRVISARK